MQTNSDCQNCDTQGMRIFYEKKKMPVHSCLMMETQQEALKFPLGDLRLGLCETCGFISNLDFDPSSQEYSAIYEAQQCFSPTFNAFAQTLANRLIEKYELHGKDIIEIGCGKGDFLILLCELGSNRGVGFDPAYSSGHNQGETSAEVTFIKDFYSEKYAGCYGDFFSCQMTLEHIPETAKFITTVRRAIGNRLDTIVFFQVPNTTRILRDLAFWDIYYEHCSYFSPGSLARLFRLCKFEVVDLYTAYDDHYLMIETRPVTSVSKVKHDLEESVGQIASDVRYFTKHIQEKLDNWEQLLEQIRSQNRRAVIWGSGSKCVAFMTTLGISQEIGAIVDINPHRHGKFIPGVGKEIVPPEFLTAFQPEVVIIMNPIYFEEIRRTLDDMGMTPELISV